MDRRSRGRRADSARLIPFLPSLKPCRSITISPHAGKTVDSDECPGMLPP